MIPSWTVGFTLYEVVKNCYRLGFLFFLMMSLPGFGQNLVVNGGFETGSFSSWTQFGNTGFSSVVSTGDAGITAPEGTRYARVGPLAAGGIFQSITTVIGASYQISYTLHAGLSISTTRFFTGQFGTATLETLTNPSLFAFTTRTFRVVATSSASLLTFTFENDPDYWRLDNVSVRRVPELSKQAAATPVLAVCLILLVGLERRRR